MPKASIPQKPLAVSRAKKKLPVELDWGKGIPKDRLRYINAKEEALIKRFRNSKAARDYAGIPAYPDPGDTAAGEKGVGGTNTGKTTGGSGSANGGKGQGGQSKGPSGAGQGPNSSSSASKSASSPSSSSKSPSSPSSTAQGGSKSPNAAAQAASNKLNGVSGAARPTTNAGPSTISGNKSPNMAASYAAQKLNATSGALKAAQQPQSIQGMINSGVSNPVSLSGRYDSGVYHNGFSKGTTTLPGQSAPNQFDNTIRPTNMVNAAHVPMDTWSKAYNANALTPGAQKIHQAITDNAFRTNTPVDFFSGAAPRSSGTRQHPAGQAIDIRLKDPITGDFVGAEKIGPLAANPIGNYKPLMGRTDKVAKAIQGAIEKPYRNFATGVINSFMDNPGVYGDFENQRWGGSFDGPWGKDYMHYDEGKITSGVNKDQEALRKEAANYRGPSSGTMLAGTPFSGGNVNLAATAPPRSSTTPGLGSSGLQAALDSWNPPKPTGIPTPNSTGMMPASGTTVAGDPRTSMPLGSYPQSQPTTAPSNPFGAVNPVAAGRLARIGTQIAVDDALSAPPAPTPNMRPASQNMQTPTGWGQEKVLSVENYVDPSNIRDPAAARMSGIQSPQAAPSGPMPSSLPGYTPPGLPGNFRGTPGMAYNYQSPSSFSPEVGPGDEVAGDYPAPQPDAPVYSDNPMQGPSNPMQEGADLEPPEVTQKRSKTYGKAGYVAGTLVGGPIIGALVGKLAEQMSLSPQRQRFSIASNPQALNANVQSINTMVEERGGKGNPNMRVTPEGFKDVLENPAQVTSNPQAYTTLEQMLAALAQGIDPETGKPI